MTKKSRIITKTLITTGSILTVLGAGAITMKALKVKGAKNQLEITEYSMAGQGVYNTYEWNLPQTYTTPTLDVTKGANLLSLGGNYSYTFFSEMKKVASPLGGRTINKSQNGMTSVQLLKEIQENNEYHKLIKNSNIITLTIGLNDMLELIEVNVPGLPKMSFADFINPKKLNTLGQQLSSRPGLDVRTKSMGNLLENISSVADPVQVIKALSPILQQMLSPNPSGHAGPNPFIVPSMNVLASKLTEVAGNINLILSTIQRCNPDAQIILTGYEDPFKQLEPAIGPLGVQIKTLFNLINTQALGGMAFTQNIKSGKLEVMYLDTNSPTPVGSKQPGIISWIDDVIVPQVQSMVHPHK